MKVTEERQDYNDVKPRFPPNSGVFQNKGLHYNLHTVYVAQWLERLAPNQKAMGSSSSHTGLPL